VNSKIGVPKSLMFANTPMAFESIEGITQDSILQLPSKLAAAITLPEGSKQQLTILLLNLALIYLEFQFTPLTTDSVYL